MFMTHTHEKISRKLAEKLQWKQPDERTRRTDLITFSASVVGKNTTCGVRVTFLQQAYSRTAVIAYDDEVWYRRGGNGVAKRGPY